MNISHFLTPMKWKSSHLELYFFVKHSLIFQLENNRFGIYVSFVHEEKPEIGVLFPGKSFINGTLLLGRRFKLNPTLRPLGPPSYS